MDTSTTKTSAENKIAFHETIVIGAGVSGICAAIKLREAKVDFIVLEKAQEVGGVWRENIYPDCACDVPSALYSYSFAPNPNWSRVFASQEEIKAYTQDTVKRFAVDEHIHFNCALSKCEWLEADKCWQLETSGGVYRARFVIMACGPMHIPLIPHIKGIETFPGKSFHSATWDANYDLNGKRVAVIGSGGSAIQFLPAIQRKVKQITLFQRTPPWVLPKVDTKISDRWRTIFTRFPFAQKLFRKVLFFQFEFLNHNLKNKWFSQRLETAAVKHIARGVKDEALREKLKPDYSLGCKRILLSNNWYKALGKDNVEVVSGITEIQGNKLIASDGSSCEVDVIIYGTGFEVSDPPIGKLIYGRNGRSLSEQWVGSPSAYLGTMAEDCPNLFLTLGPNLYTYTSAFVIIEAQVKYILSAITKARKKKIATISVDGDTSAKLNKDLQNALQGTVWNSGCASYFIDKTGRNSVNWPWTTMKMQRRLSKIKLSEFQIEKH
ncbi:MAG: cation diffusion facilitator CzcD-associated flavoprotein CzcO [Zhongshania aliphaticivorans]|jgi:cation diffusion facilitator CzcD-associated flavoprotein CzcO|uniref:flavin-containing monooxygenase n=1 Tax=Zhongshania aliphaticivorans TaxID=1470434 RepID=UPI0039E24B4A|tara:strand:+ start:2053 stop:3534 length:1482 start_codon:yes stop_codon:yes gene_type:complete